MHLPSRTRSSLALLLLAGFSAGACVPSDFDDALAKAPVLSLGAPGGYKARDVGKVVRPLAVSPVRKAAGVTGRFLVSGTDYPSLAVVELDAKGRATTYVASEAQLADLTAEGNTPLLSAAEILDPAGGPSRVVLGAPNAAKTVKDADPRGRIFYLDLIDSDKGVELKVTRGPDSGARSLFGLGLAAGQVSGTTKSDIVVVSLNQTVLFEDGDDTSPIEAVGCDVTFENTIEPKWLFRAVAIGDVASVPGREGNEIMVGVPQKGSVAPGKVQVLRKGAATMTAPKGVLECVTTINPPTPQGESKFGASLAVADVDGDGVSDLVIGDPPFHVFVHYGPIDAMPPRTLDIKAPFEPGAPTGEFGYRVAVMDVDGVAGQEIVVSAPDSAVSNQPGVGEVFIFSKDGMLLHKVPQDSAQTEKSSVGLTLTPLEFASCNGSRNILVIGSTEQVFTYFRLPGQQLDVRCF